MRADNGGVGIEYEVTGEGRPVVLLHGFPDSGRLWRHQVRALADAGFKVIVPDMRGDGAPRTSRTTWRPTTCSSWSPMSRRWRRSPPERVDHLVTLSVGHPSTFRSDGFVRGHCRALAVRRRLGQLPPLGASSRRRCGHRRARGQRPRCRLPPLGVWSSGDIALTEGQMTRSAGQVAGLWRYERLDGPGHWMQLEAPEEVNRLLVDFLPSA